MSKEAVCDFLRRCVLYADSSINRKKERDEDMAEIERWAAYRDFTAYALSEIERGELLELVKEVLQPLLGRSYTPAPLTSASPHSLFLTGSLPGTLDRMEPAQ